MHHHLLKVCAGLIVCVVLIQCELVVENGEYSNVVVAFSDNVPSDKGIELLNNLMTILQNASAVLQAAIGIRFSKVTVVIPMSWNTEEGNITAGSFYTNQSNSQPHILVHGNNDSVFGKFPFAHQYGSCGTPGSQFTIPTAFLSSTLDYPKETVLAREWLKYRYGVFDENGFPKDKLYPLYYSIPGTDPSDVKVTDCTNVPVTYSFIDKSGNNCTRIDRITGLPDEERCILTPNEENLETLTSSLMYFQEKLQSMRDICGKDEEHKHISRSPNKHNALCRGQSIWNVLNTSSDFQNGQAPAGSNNIEFDFVKQAYPRTVIAFENTNKMKPKGEIMFKAIQRFVYELPDGSKSALIPFSDKARGDSSLRELNDWPHDRKLKVDANFGNPADGCVTCAILKAEEILSADNSQSEGTIVVIVHSSLTSNEELEKIKSSKLCLVFIVFNPDVLQEYKDYANSLLCGTVMDFSSLEGIEVFKEVYETMKALLPEIINDKSRETKITEYVPSEGSISVRVDRTVEKVIFWMFFKIEEEALELTLEDENLEKKEEFRESDIVAFSYTPKAYDDGDLKFKIKYANNEILTQVSVISRPGRYYSIQIFIQDTTEKEAPNQQMPIIIYASVRFGFYPVQNAEVEAKVWTPDGKNVTLAMYDDGKGDPDITENDGVYSRYFTGFTTKGDYTVEVTVKSNGGLAEIGRIVQIVPENEGFRTCCGSRIRSGSLPLPLFSKTSRASFSAISGRPENGYKPSRVADLIIDSVTDDKVVLKWSAPGAEADTGSVGSYEIKYFTSREEAEQQSDNGKLLNNTSLTPLPRGSTVILEVNIREFEESALYYITVRAKTAEQISDASNIVEIFIPDTEVSTSDKDITTDDDKNVKAGSANKSTVGIIIGVILAVVVVVILIYLAIYFFLLKPKRKEEERREEKRRENQANKMKNPPAENQVKNSSNDNRVLNPINYIPADTILKNHNEKLRAKAENKDQPIFREEDFEARNSAPTNLPRDNNNEEEAGYSQVNRFSKDEELIPPKSPKRTTCV